ncbi:hypothetical protein GCM10023235_10810 [Kitasatospora terrestris]|uniref:Uncharacterized protein n=1 Tax=Kitasatospora terrestris TaxID=258051 RepID=A0ABP9DBZ8_9ACTN
MDHLTGARGSARDDRSMNNNEREESGRARGDFSATPDGVAPMRADARLLDVYVEGIWMHLRAELTGHCGPAERESPARPRQVPGPGRRRG